MLKGRLDLMLSRRRVGWERLVLAAPLWLAGAGAAPPLTAQAMAHKGWAGNGFAVDTWWKNAVFYEIDPLDFQDSNGDGFGDLGGLASRLDYLQSLGVDAIVLSPFRVQSGPHAAQGTAWEAVYGTDEDFDRLEQEASRRHMRLVVDLPLDQSQGADQMAAAGRFWLSRGVAGLRLSHAGAASVLSAEETAARVRMLRHLCAGYAGDRVLLGDAAGANSAASVAFAVHKPGHRAAGAPGDTSVAAPQISFDETPKELTQWNQATVRALLQGEAGNETERLVRSDGPERPRTPGRLAGPEDRAAGSRAAEQVARQLAVVLLAGREWPLLYFGQEIGMASKPVDAGPSPMQWGGDLGFSSSAPWVAMGPNAETATVSREDADPASLLNWYRRLSELRHGQTALRTGSLNVLDSTDPEVVAWVRRGTGENAHATPVLVVLNLSDRPLVVSMRDSLHRVGLEASSGVKPLAVAPAGAKPSFTASSIELQAHGSYVGELRQAGLEASSSTPSRQGRHKGR